MTSLTEPGNDSHSSILEEKVQKGLLSLIPAQTMIIDYDYKQVEVPHEIVAYCVGYTFGAKPDDLRFLDCVYMNMGYYGNDPEHLKKLREQIIPVFE